MRLHLLNACVAEFKDVDGLTYAAQHALPILLLLLLKSYTKYKIKHIKTIKVKEIR